MTAKTVETFQVAGHHYKITQGNPADQGMTTADFIVWHNGCSGSVWRAIIQARLAILSHVTTCLQADMEHHAKLALEAEAALHRLDMDVFNLAIFKKPEGVETCGATEVAPVGPSGAGPKSGPKGSKRTRT